MRQFTNIMYNDYLEIKKTKKINPKKYNEIEYFTRLYLNLKEDICLEERDNDEEYTALNIYILDILKEQLKSMRHDSKYMYYRKYKHFLKMLDYIK